MSTEVAEQVQPEEQAPKQPEEATAENGDSSSKVEEVNEEVKSKLSEKEEQSAPPSSTDAAADSTTCSPLEEKIIRQIEFYFGDRNLPKDKFLQQAVASDDDGWVPLSTLLTFNRLKALSSDAEFIASALKKTKNDIIEVNGDGSHVRRNPSKPAPDIFSVEERIKIKGKTVYVKGFNEDTKLDDLQDFFSQYGKTEYIQMRRTLTPDKKFKGSVFVEFAEKPMADNFLGLPAVKFNDTELLKESKEAYFARKQEERKQVKEQKAAEREAEAERKKSAEEEAEDEGPESSVKTAGCILFFKGCGDDTSREDIKEKMREFATVAFVDFGRGQTEGYVRFEEEQGAQKALEGMTADGAKPMLNGAETELKVLEGEEEEQYWQKLVASKSKGKGRGRSWRGRRSGGPGRGGHYWRGGGRKRRQQSSASEDVGGGDDGEASPPAAKQSKSEDKEE